MEVCVTLAGIKQLPRLCATANLEADMVNHFVIDNIIMANITVYTYIVAEPLYGLGFPIPGTRRFVAQRFNCSSTTGGLKNCSYSSLIDAQCNIGPHVAGVRCTESKNLRNIRQPQLGYAFIRFYNLQKINIGPREEPDN